MATEGPGTWSPYVVVRHLIFTERTDWMPRLTIIQERGTERTFDPFDHEGQFREGGGKSAFGRCSMNFTICAAIPSRACEQWTLPPSNWRSRGCIRRSVW